MTCWAIIPVKAPSDSKSRLAGALDAAAREALVDAMLLHVLEAAGNARAIDRTLLIGPSRLAIPSSTLLLTDPGGGLNRALHSALAHAAAETVDRVVFIAADLAQVTAQELDLLALPPSATVAIAPDRHGTGTNALSLPLPDALDFSFAFGPDSFAAHQAEADRLGLKVEFIHGHGLARDVDVPEDLADAAHLLRPGG